MSGRVLVGGEALIDLVLEPDGALGAHVGGGPFNAARTLGRLGVPVAFLGALADDAFGRRLRAALADDGVALDRAQGSTLPTTLALAELDAGGSASYRFYAEGTAAPALTREAALAAAHAGPVAALHVGTLGLVLEPMAGALEAAVAALAGRALVLVDPNCRPSLIPDRARYLARLDGVLARADVVKASVEDLAYLEPRLGPLDAAAALLARGPRLALVTRGADGAIAATADWRASVPAPSIAVVDTVGAGDAFGAAWLASWLAVDADPRALDDRERLLAATAFACRVAALTCTRRGAVPPRVGEHGLRLPER